MNVSLNRVSFLTLAVCCASFSQANFSGITAFGDSLSDMGNVSSATFGFSPGANYWQGRWSNGNVWVEQYAASQAWSISRSRAGGNNWAYGGATSAGGTFGFGFPNMLSQVNSYLGSSPTITSNRMFTLWAGGNDYLNGETNPYTPVGNISSGISTLYSRGARVFLIPNLPLLGNTPRNLGTSSEGPANAISVAHNAILKGSLASLRATLTGITIYEMDVATRFEAVRANPSAFGLTNVTQAALNGNTVVPNPDSYLFYDGIHPTRKGHEILQNLAVESVPEPTSIVVLGMGLVATLQKRRVAKRLVK